jgi:hypothetical protein
MKEHILYIKFVYVLPLVFYNVMRNIVILFYVGILI